MAGETEAATAAAQEAATAGANTGTLPTGENVTAAEAEASGETGNATNCGICDDLYYDVAIPLVYPMQPITIEYVWITEERTVTQFLGVNLDGSFERTFNRPDADPPLAIVDTNRIGIKVTGIGHAGVALINGRTGETAYYEFGRYSGNGEVRKRSVPNVTIGDDKNPTRASLNALMAALTRTNGGPYGFNGVYIKRNEGRFALMQAYAEAFKKQYEDGEGVDYDASNNHCFTFAVDVVRAGGIVASLAGATPLEIILIERILFGGDQIETPADLIFELPSRQVQVLQRQHPPINVDRGGDITGGFSFP